jgi:hypothetical protein
MNKNLINVNNKKLKDQFIYIKKVVGFWGKFCEMIGPKILKFKKIEEEKRKKIKIFNLNNNNNNNKIIFKHFY